MSMKAKEKPTKNKKTLTSQSKSMTKAKPKAKSMPATKRSSSTAMLSQKMASTTSARSATKSVAAKPVMADAMPARKSGLKRPSTWLIGAWVVIIAVALYYFRGQFIVATVNGQPILRSSLMRELEKQSGKQVLDTLILKTVIMQEAAKQKVGVTPEEVDEEVKKLEETFKGRGQDIDSALAVQGMTRADLKEQMMLQKLVERMAGKEVTVTDDEVKEYMEANKAFLPKDAKPEELKVEIKKQLEQQKLTAKIQEWVTKLKEGAKVQHWLFQ